jgi:hypothetical protein
MQILFLLWVVHYVSKHPFKAETWIALLCILTLLLLGASLPSVSTEVTPVPQNHTEYVADPPTTPSAAPVADLVPIEPWQTRGNENITKEEFQRKAALYQEALEAFRERRRAAGAPMP